jgi:hypothetical protein
VPADNAVEDLFVRDCDVDRDGMFDEANAVATVRVNVGPAGQEAAPPAQLVVERAMYWDAAGTVWAAGANLLGTPIP